MSDWLKYPENKPPSEKPTWYLVKMDDGTECQACAWFGDWYCFAEWYRIVEFLPNKACTRQGVGVALSSNNQGFTPCG